MRLSVDMLGAKELLATLANQRFYGVYEFATRIVSPSRVPFRIFVR